MVRPWQRILIAVIVATGFVMLWAAIAFQWQGMLWAVLALYAVLLLGLVFGVARRRRGTVGPGVSHPSASDEYSDLILGRTSPTFPEPGVQSTSLVEDPPGDSNRPLPPR